MDLDFADMLKVQRNNLQLPKIIFQRGIYFRLVDRGRNGKISRND